MKLGMFGNLFAREVGEVEAALATYFERPAGPDSHYGLIRYHLGFADETFRPLNGERLPRGKRVRPILCMLIGRAVGAPRSSLVGLMLAAELMHNASIVHDDVQDQEHLRWGRPTLWSRFGIAQAINAGDALIGHVYDLLLDLRQTVPDITVLDVLATFNRTHLRMAEGQHLDLAYQGRIDITVEQYLDVISRKTAAACECVAHAAALLAQRDADATDRYRRFGHAFGMLYQVCDDINSIWATSEATGKRSMGDLLLCKANLPLIYGVSSGSPALKDLLLRARQGDEPLDERQAEIVREHLTEAGADDLCREHVRAYRDEALALLAESGLAESPEHQLLRTMTILTAQVAGVPPGATQS